MNLRARTTVLVSSLLLVPVLIATFSLLFSFSIEDMLEKWQRPEYNHAYMIPLVAVYLVWLRARDLVALPQGRSWLGVGLVILALGLNAIGNFSAVVTISQYALVLALWGLAIAAGGRAAIPVLWVPMLYLVFMIPLPNIIETQLTTGLQLISSRLGVAVIRLAGVVVNLEGNVIDLGGYKLQVAEACSGMRYLFPLVSFGYLCAVLFRGPWWQRAILLLSTVPITILMNSVRIGVIGILVNSFGSAQAEGFLHFFEGWVIFMACVAILFFEVWIFARLQGRPTLEIFGLDTPPVSDLTSLLRLRPNTPSVVGLGILMAAAALSLFISRPLPLAPDLNTSFRVFPLRVGSWRGEELPVDPAQLEALKTTDYFSAMYGGEKTSPPVSLWVTYYESQIQGSSVHSPKACLPGGGWQIQQFAPHTVPGVLPGGGGLTVNRAIIGIGDDRQLVYYWFPQRGRNLTSELAVKWYIFWDGLTQRRSDGSMVRLITSLSGGEAGLVEADQRLESFLRDVSPSLAYHLPGSAVPLRAVKGTGP